MFVLKLHGAVNRLSISCPIHYERTAAIIITSQHVYGMMLVSFHSSIPHYDIRDETRILRMRNVSYVNANKNAG
jgi:hypothetical protein